MLHFIDPAQEGNIFENDMIITYKDKIKEKIKNWFKEYNFSDDKYKIRDDYTIDFYGDFFFIDKNIEEFPDFIKFNVINGDFIVKFNNWKSIKGFPSEIKGCINMTMYKNPLRLELKKQLKKITIYGNTWI